MFSKIREFPEFRTRLLNAGHDNPGCYTDGSDPKQKKDVLEYGAENKNC